MTQGNAVLLALGLVIYCALPASAATEEMPQENYQFCNETSFVLEAALGYPHQSERGAGVRSKGWASILPGRCATLLEGALAEGVYYVFARSLGAHRGPPLIFGGEALLCVRPMAENFMLDEHVFCHITEPGERGEKLGFAEVKVNRPHWTTVFSPRQTFSSRRHAMVAGVQRLLEDNDYKIGTIDGFAGKMTLQAVQAFQRRHELPPTGIINAALFERLISEAELREKEAGLNICNDSQYFVWSAVGYRSRGPDPEFESNGWVRIPPHACRTAIYERLEQAIYYIYAEARNEEGAWPQHENGAPIVWEGDFLMCVAQTKFSIRGSGRCEARGYQSVRFRRLENHGATRFTEHLTLQ